MYKKIICILIFVIVPLVVPQSIDVPESRFSSLKNTIEKEQQMLESFQQKFNARVKEINLEKSKINPDKEAITTLMANSVSLSKSIEEQHRKINLLKISLESVKTKLGEKYAVIIDSLKTEKEKNLSREIDDLILLYTTKRLEVSPEFSQLSFNPYKILELDLNNADSADKKLYKEYLLNALDEVNKILNHVSKQSEETEQIVKLQRKTGRFVEETQMESRIPSGSISFKESPSSEDRGRGFYEADPNADAVYNAEQNLNNYVQVYEHLLNQLNIVKVSSSEYDNLLALEKNLDLNSYNKILKEIKKRLTEYKKLLEQKTGSS